MFAVLTDTDGTVWELYLREARSDGWLACKLVLAATSPVQARKGNYWISWQAARSAYPRRADVTLLAVCRPRMYLWIAELFMRTACTLPELFADPSIARQLTPWAVNCADEGYTLATSNPRVNQAVLL